MEITKPAGARPADWRLTLDTDWAQCAIVPAASDVTGEGSQLLLSEGDALPEGDVLSGPSLTSKHSLREMLSLREG